MECELNRTNLSLKIPFLLFLFKNKANIWYLDPSAYALAKPWEHLSPERQVLRRFAVFDCYLCALAGQESFNEA